MIKVLHIFLFLAVILNVVHASPMVVVGTFFEQPVCSGVYKPAVSLVELNRKQEKIAGTVFHELDLELDVQGGSTSCVDVSSDVHQRNLFYVWEASRGSFIDISSSGKDTFSRVRWSVALGEGEHADLKAYVGDSLGSIVVKDLSIQEEGNTSDIYIGEVSDIEEGSVIQVDVGFRTTSSLSRRIVLSVDKELIIQPDTVTIPPNLADRVSVNIISPDDETINGNRVATITATSVDAVEAPVTRVLKVIDNDRVNLVVTDFSVPDEVQINQPVPLDATVHNQGNLPSLNTTPVVFYLSNDDLADAGDTRLGEVDILALNVDSSQQVAFNTVFTQAGYKWLFVCIDSAASGVEEGVNFASDCSVSQRIEVQASDIVISSAIFDLSETRPGEQRKLTVEVKNTGTVTSSAGEIRFYRSNDSDLDTTDDYMASLAMPVLSPGESKKAQWFFMAPAEPGDYWFGGCIVAQKNESDVDNNCSAAKKLKVNDTAIVVSSVSPEQVALDVKQEFVISGKNLPETLTIAVEDCISLEKSANVTDTRVSFSCTPSVVGRKKGVIMDRSGGDTVHEFTINVIAVEDFTVIHQRLSKSSVFAGQSVTGFAIQRYAPGTSSKKRRPYLGYYLSRDKVLSSDDSLLAEKQSLLRSGRRKDKVKAELMIPASVSAGQYYVLFVADHANDYSEVDEENNVQVKKLTIRPEDFTVDDQHLSKSSVFAGQSVTGSATQRYAVGASSEKRRPYLGYYLSRDKVLSSDDSLLAAKQSSLSNDRREEEEEAKLTIPASVSAGQYYVLFVADHTNDYSEVDEENNVQVKKLTVQLAENFTVSSYRLSQKIVDAGGSVQGSAIQRYRGTSTKSRRPYLGYYLSRDAVLSRGDTLLASDRSHLNKSNRKEKEAATLKIPKSKAPGQYFILFVADYKKEFREIDEEDNVKASKLVINSPADQ